MAWTFLMAAFISAASDSTVGLRFVVCANAGTFPDRLAMANAISPIVNGKCVLEKVGMGLWGLVVSLTESYHPPETQVNRE
jgi:hypothetical protein